MDTKGQCHFAKHVRTSLFCNIFFCLIVFRISRKTSSVCEKCGQHYRDSLVYWLQFKDDDEFPSVAFGNIAGGSAPWARRPSACSAPFRELRVPKARLLRDREPHPAECGALQASAQVRRSDSSGSRQTPAASQRSAAVRPACRTYATPRRRWAQRGAACLHELRVFRASRSSIRSVSSRSRRCAGHAQQMVVRFRIVARPTTDTPRMRGWRAPRQAVRASVSRSVVGRTPPQARIGLLTHFA